MGPDREALLARPPGRPRVEPGAASGRRTLLPALLLAASLAAPAPVPADMIDTEGMEPYEVCGLCHGLTGLSHSAKFPRLAGQRAAYIEKQLHDIRAGLRSNDGGQMSAIVTEVAEADIPTIAAWFAHQDAPEPDAPEGDATAGARLYAELGCAACHGAADPPEGLVPPRLFAQHERYLVKQLEDFREGRRGNDPGGVMRERAAGLDDAAIAALAAYLASTPRD